MIKIQYVRWPELDTCQGPVFQSPSLLAHMVKKTNCFKVVVVADACATTNNESYLKKYILGDQNK